MLSPFLQWRRCYMILEKPNYVMSSELSLYPLRTAMNHILGPLHVRNSYIPECICSKTFSTIIWHHRFPIYGQLLYIIRRLHALQKQYYQMIPDKNGFVVIEVSALQPCKITFKLTFISLDARSSHIQGSFSVENVFKRVEPLLKRVVLL